MLYFMYSLTILNAINLYIIINIQFIYYRSLSSPRFKFQEQFKFQEVEFTVEEQWFCESESDKTVLDRFYE